MDKYKIKPYTYKRAKEIGVQVFPSDNLKYKLEVYDKDGVFIAYVGANGYSDFPTYTKTKGKEYADERRRLYKIRHQKNRLKVGSKSYLADNLLW
tara:strand:+ start:28 stop:312 length:285 start_codon:yes stop_codon:yes gene_type:complete